MIRALFVIAVMFAYVFVVGTPLLLYSVLAGESQALYDAGVWGCKFILWLAGVRLEVHGRERIPPNGALVFMSNHQGNCDPPAVISILPPVAALVKEGLFRVPVLGRAMRVCGFIPVDRANRERATEAVEHGVEALRAGKSLLVFPEGTRSRDGRLLPFKRGVFVMAIKAQVPIVPISVSGSGKIMQKGKFALRPGLVRITVHEAIPTAGQGLDDRGQVMERVRQAILSGLTAEEMPLTPVLLTR
jgi:1-acyl-sn-glycerol-3-phosphate acyltransferase